MLPSQPVRPSAEHPARHTANLTDSIGAVHKTHSAPPAGGPSGIRGRQRGAPSGRSSANFDILTKNGVMWVVARTMEGYTICRWMSMGSSARKNVIAIVPPSVVPPSRFLGSESALFCSAADRPTIGVLPKPGNSVRPRAGPAGSRDVPCRGSRECGWFAAAEIASPFRAATRQLSDTFSRGLGACKE